MATAADLAAPHGDDLQFRGSAEPTIGVELELQLLDRETMDLAPGAVRILQMAQEEKLDGVAAELMQSMIEVKTGICGSVQEARDQLLLVLKRVRRFAGSLNMDLALGGTHPFNRSSGSAVSPSERYERVVERLAWLTYQRVVFGLHIHVGVPDGDLALGTINYLVRCLPHLLALSSNSPFWQGVDTGLASTRAALYGLLPHAGVPPHFGKWKEFLAYCQVMRDSKALGSFKDIYWDIRPRPDFGTIEFRICDMPDSISLALALVALTRCLVIDALKLLREKPQLQRGDLRRHWIANENKWLATRYGMQAMYIRTPGGKRRPLNKDLAELLNTLAPLAQATGDYPFLAPILPLDQFETGSNRQRQQFRASGDWKAVLTDQVRRFGEELEKL